MKTLASTLFTAVATCALALPLAAHAQSASGSRHERQEAAEAAQEQVEESFQEPFLGDSAQAQEKGSVQLGLQPRLRRSGEKEGLETPLHAEVGLTDQLQLEAELPVQLAAGMGVSNGVGNAEVGALYGFVSNRETGFVFSAGLNALLPTASNTVGDRAYGVTPRLLALEDFGPAIVNGSVGLDVSRTTEDGASWNAEPELALALLGKLGAVRPLFEVAAQFQDEGTQLALSPGVLVELGEDLELGLAVPFEREASGGPLEAGGALTLQWEGLKFGP